MKRRWNSHKVILMAAGLVLFMTAALGGGILWSNHMAEKQTVKAATKEVAAYVEAEDANGITGWEQDITYKQHVQNTDTGEEIGKKVSEKFDFNWETVTLGAVSREARDYEEALRVQRNLAERPLFHEYANELPEGKGYDEWEYWSLELYICEVYAFSEGKDVIEAYCKEHNIDPVKSLVSDLSVEDIIAIGQLAYETSDHPKD